MNTLTKLRDSFLGYISPRKPQRNPAVKTTGPKTSPVAVNFLEERRKLEPSRLSVGGNKAQKVITGRVVKTTSYKTTLGPDVKKISKEVAKEKEVIIITDSEDVPTTETDEYELSAEEDPEETETVILPEPEFFDDDPTFINDDDEYKENRKVVEQYSEEEEESVELNDEDLEITLINGDVDSEGSEESEVSGEDKVRNYLSNQSVAPQSSPNSKIRSSKQTDHDFHPDESALWARLEARGNEPIIPAHWAQDFRTFTADFFSADLEETFINSASGKDFQGKLLSHFQNLA